MSKFNVEVVMEKIVCSSNNEGFCDLLLRDGHRVSCPGACSLFKPVAVALSPALAG